MRAEARVLCVSAFPDLGGGEISLLDTVTCLTARGVDVDVLNLVDRPGALTDALRERDVRVHHCRIGRFRDPRGVVRATRWFARHASGFDLVLANDGRAALYTAAGLALRRRPYVWHVRDLVGAGHALERLAVR